MSLDSNKTGDSIAAYLQSVKPSPGTPVTTNQLKIMWEGIMNIIYGDVKSDAEILPNTFKVTDDDTSLGGAIEILPVEGKGKVI